MKMPTFGQKIHHEGKQQEAVLTVFLDNEIKNAIASCSCKVLFQETCVLGEHWKCCKYCTLYLCEYQGRLINEDKEDNCEICFNVVLNKCRTNELIYEIKDNFLHEFNQKLGAKWQKPFILKFDEGDKKSYQDFETELKTILQKVKLSTETIPIYRLLAIQTKVQKERNSLVANIFSTPSACKIIKQPLEEMNVMTRHKNVTEEKCEYSDENSSKESIEDAIGNLAPPFDIAPFIPSLVIGNHVSDSYNNISKDTETVKSNEYLQDSLHIHPSEFPQSFDSILNSADLEAFTYIKPKSDDQQVVFNERQNKDITAHTRNFYSDDYMQMGIMKQMAKPNSEEICATMVRSDQCLEPYSYNSYNNISKDTETVKSNEYLQDSLHIHPSEFPQSFDSILNSADLEASTYIKPNSDDQQVVFNERQNKDITAHTRNFYSDDYMQMDIMKQMAKPNSEEICATMVRSDQCLEPNNSEHTLQNAKLQHMQELAHDLEEAINEKVAADAQRFANMLALENVKVSISVQLKQDDENDKEFRLKVNIEDRDNSGGPIRLTVRATDTIQDLKNKMLLKHMFPVEVQYWIIGKRIPLDTETLAQCKIKTHGYTAFLYLVSAKSANLTKAEFLRCHKSSESDVNAAGFTPPTVASQMSCGLTAGVNPVAGGGVPLNTKLDDISPYYLNKVKFEKTTRTKLPVPKKRQSSPGQDLINKHGPSAKARNRVTYGPPANIGNLSEKESEPFQETATRVTLLKIAPKVPAEDDEPMAQKNERRQNFKHIQLMDNTGFIPNSDPFSCPICFEDISVDQGVVLRECLHTFCRDCLKDAVIYNEEPTLKCPYHDDSYSCDGVLQDREVKALVSKDVYSRYLARSLALAESQAQNSFHCKTADCPGWCIYEDHINFYLCPVCFKENCLTCKAIHLGMNCKQYQDDLKIRAVNDKAASQTQLMIRKMLDDGDAMNCPQCQIIVMKKEGCNWIQCSICKTEICWVTKGPRWGPEGNGDISGGCRCQVNGVMCHPDCNNCH